MSSKEIGPRTYLCGMVTGLASTTPHMNMHYILQSLVPFHLRKKLVHWPSIQLLIGKVLYLQIRKGS